MTASTATALEPSVLEPHAACPSCGARGLEIFHEQRTVPVHSCRLLPSRAEATMFPRGSLRLGFCAGCGFISNTAFDGSFQDYAVSYEETQGFSPRFRAFARELAAGWVEKYDLHGKDLLEIGCGKGEFLALMCELGGNRGIGVDPAFVPERMESEAAGRMTFIRDLYSEQYAHLTGDAVICRHTLEHIADVGEFVRLIRRSLGDRTDTVVLFELPDMMRVLREVAFWDIYYEHCSYFTAGSLARLFRLAGFEVLDLTLDFDDQYILIECRPATDGSRGACFELEEEPDELARAVADFRAGFAAKVAYWQREVRSVRERGGTAVIWGSGSKGVSFLTTLELGDDIACAVDINPYRHGMFMAGSGHEIVSPESLRELKPELVIAMNAIYLDEIRRSLDDLGLTPRLAAV